MSKPKLPHRQLSIWHLRRYKSESEVLRHRDRLTRFRILVDDIERSVYIVRPEEKPPQWSNFFEDRISLAEFGTSASLGAILLIDIHDQAFAITFGSGRFYLATDSFKERFGFQVVLNSVVDVRSLDKKTFDDIGTQTRSQAIKDANVYQFGIDVEKDLLRAVTGRPEDEKFGIRMSGVDALVVNVAIDLSNLPSLCYEYYLQSRKDIYKKNEFSFVDNIKPIADPGLINKLDERMLSSIDSSGRSNKVQLVFPEVIDYGYFEYFRYTPGSIENLNDVSLTSFFQAVQRNGWAVSVESIKNRVVYGVRATGEVETIASIYRCLHAEIKFGKGEFILSSGKWYRIDRDFLKALDDYVASIDVHPYLFPAYADVDEGSYNDRVQTSSRDFLLFDKKLFHPEKGQTFEFCDLYTDAHGAKDLIHVKHGKSSSGLSHLFAQGAVSAEAFVEFEKVREELNSRLPAAKRLRNCSDPLDTKMYRVVFAIIRKTNRKLPFFTRVNLRQACRRLHRMGFKTALSIILVDPTWSRKKTITPKGAKRP